MKTLELFKKIAATNLNQYLEEAKSQGTKIIGHFCNLPEEIIMAAGMIPYRMRAVESTKTTKGDIWYSTVNCSFPRNCLDQILEKKFDFIDGLVVVNSCDHIRRMYDNCKYGNEDIFSKFLYMFALPHTITPESIGHFKREIKLFCSALEDNFKVTITEEKIREAISTCNQTRKLLGFLYELRKQDPPPIKGAETLAVILACTALPKSIANESLQKLLKEIHNRTVVPKGTPRLMVAAGHFEEIDYLEWLEKDAVVVADSLCFGARYLRNQVDEKNKDPVEALAYRYASIPCPRMVDSFQTRMNIFNDDIKEYNVDGFIVDSLKFCLHWQIFRHMIEKESEKGGLSSTPLLVLERELHTAAEGQVRTRIQAFLEQINVVKNV